MKEILNTILFAAILATVAYSGYTAYNVWRFRVGAADNLTAQAQAMVSIARSLETIASNTTPSRHTCPSWQNSIPTLGNPIVQID